VTDYAPVCIVFSLLGICWVLGCCADQLHRIADALIEDTPRDERE
jgi:hypothetical protein